MVEHPIFILNQVQKSRSEVSGGRGVTTSLELPRNVHMAVIARVKNSVFNEIG